ncbi:MAG: cation transporter [Candidatus Riflebacteria bacterium]|nr:cation transporter [Candidatus Riflebacteria bacterium]
MPDKALTDRKINHVSPNPETCKKCAAQTQFFSLLGNIFLAIFKGIAGTITGSLGLIADATHSSADVLNSFVVMIALNISELPPDENHPYGHGKVENISGLFVGIILFFGAALIIDSSVEQLMSDGPFDTPHPIGIMVAIISVIANELFFRQEICASRRVNSPAIEADAWENRMDAIATVSVLFGILGAQAGYPKLDPLAALLVGFFTGPIAWSLVSKNIEGLMDGGQTHDLVAQISKLVISNPDVKGLGYVKTRPAGRHILIDLEILVSGDTSVTKSEEIASTIRKTLLSNVEHAGVITIVCKSESLNHAIPVPGEFTADVTD